MVAVDNNSSWQQSFANNSKILYVDSSVSSIVVFKEIIQTIGFPYTKIRLTQSLEKALWIIQKAPSNSDFVGLDFFKVIIVDYSCLTEYDQAKDQTTNFPVIVQQFMQ